MLELLHIENIAVIEQADIQFRPGFNALTGETGAGKSIVIDAMGAVLGGRTSRDLIRTGAEKSFVSAEFSQVPADLPVLHVSRVGRIHTLIMRMNAQEAAARLAVYDPMLVDAVPLTLEEIFIYELGGADYAVKDIVL